MAFMEDFHHLKIPLEDIITATDNFDELKMIGKGGFGKVYKGEVSHSKGRTMAALKRLDPKDGQGAAEFSKEIRVLSQCKHQNIISLLGFCEYGREKILVYEYASNRSLDRHLGSPALKWGRRLKICLEAAKALDYLHDPKGTHQRVLHCDIKSANILLDDNWIAKLSDLGLSKRGPANQQDTFIISSAVGTLGYLDPLYLEKGFLSKESDVYSFGVLLFEVLYGKLCYEIIDRQVHFLVSTWQQNYDENKIDGVYMFQDMDPSSLKIFSDIAYRCLKRSREDRPKMAEVVIELDSALQHQEIREGKGQLVDYEKMVTAAKPPLNYGSKAELMMHLSKQGVLLNAGKTWFSLNTKGEHCEMISIAQCLNPNESDSSRYSSEHGSRFPVGCYEQNNDKFKARVRTQFLSPQVTYTVNLVFKTRSEKAKKDQYIALKYKSGGETETSTSYLASIREDGFYMAELYHFTSDRRIVDLEIIFYGCYSEISKSIILEGIEFCPLDKVENDQVSESEDEKVDMQPPISDSSDAYWEAKLPIDYQDILKRSKDKLFKTKNKKKRSKDNVIWRTKKELYSILSKGFMINDGQEWFSLDQNGKKCVMLSARMVLGEQGSPSTSSSLFNSRFGVVTVLSDFWRYEFIGEIKAEVVSPQTTYASYLVYKLPEEQEDLSSCVGPTAVMEKDLVSGSWKRDDCWYMYFISPQTPVIRRNVDNNSHNPMNRPKIKGIPQQRSDGWMEVPIWEFQTGITAKMIPICLRLKRTDVPIIDGLVIQGIEFRPI